MTFALLTPESQSLLVEVLSTALKRSFTHKAVVRANEENAESALLWVIADAPEAWADHIIALLAASRRKILLLGRLPAKVADHIGAIVMPLSSDCVNIHSLPAATYNSAESPAMVRYGNVKSLLGIDCPLPLRPCTRYDFTNEWNNLGYGAITNDGSIWSLAAQVQWPADGVLAHVEENQKPITDYAGLWRGNGSSLLWFNRNAGPVDSQEWRLVERYFSSYDYPHAPCIPALCEVPHGYDAAVTMRLDCDEDIATAESLHDVYAGEHIPFSLAITTCLLTEPQHIPFLHNFLHHGGALLSHSATHPTHWGGTYEEACRQAVASRDAIERALDYRIRYAVSPFHQNPPYAVKALADNGFTGFIGGLIRNDPEYLLARGGIPPFAPQGFISHSQQCMLHGDCMLNGDDPLKIFKQSFDIYRKAGALFGYLDHPFSSRYKYGWTSEKVRSQAHHTFITYMRKSGQVLFLSEHDALDWIGYISQVSLKQTHGSWEMTTAQSSPFMLNVEYAGTLQPVRNAS